MSSNFLSLNLSETEFLIFGLPQQLSKLNNPTIYLPNNVILSPVDSARNLGVIFDKNLSFAQHISSISKSCFLNIRDQRRSHNTIDQTIACTIANYLIHSKIDYCNSFLLNLPATQPIVFNLSLTLLLVLSPKLINFITLHLFLNLSTGESNTTFSLTYKSLKTGQPSYLRSLLSFLHIVVLGLPLLSPLVALLSPLVLK